jgi:polar amino acid transport system substrate-binding protein
MRTWALGLVWWALIAGASAQDLRIAVDASTEMPWSEVTEGVLTGGLHRDFGMALARQLARQPRFLLLPRKRLTEALARGDADLTCGLMPAWLPGPFDWTAGFFEENDVMLTLRDAPRPARLADLAGQPVGTINGFSYPELQRLLGQGFVRDDAPTATANLAKLAAGRVRHAVVNQRFLEYQLRYRGLKLALYPPLQVNRNELACAVSRRGTTTALQIEQAVHRLKAGGSLPQLLSSRP